jgi:hypothetical protein
MTLFRIAQVGTKTVVSGSTMPRIVLKTAQIDILKTTQITIDHHDITATIDRYIYNKRIICVGYSGIW